MPRSHVETVELIIQALGNENVAEAFDLGVQAGVMAPDAELVPARELMGDVTYRGKDGFVEFMRRWTEDFDDWTLRLDEVVEASGDVTAAVLTQTGTGRGSGVPTKLVHGAVSRFEDDRVVRIELYLHPKDALEAAGLPEWPQRGSS